LRLFHPFAMAGGRVWRLAVSNIASQKVIAQVQLGKGLVGFTRSSETIALLSAILRLVGVARVRGRSQCLQGPQKKSDSINLDAQSL